MLYYGLLRNEPYYYYPSHLYQHYYRQYPPVDESTFIQSVHTFQRITQEASTILGKLSSRPFAHQLMTAAQKGDQQEVDRLIKSIGVSLPVVTKYTPTGIELKIFAQAQGTNCCTLTMNLRWGA